MQSLTFSPIYLLQNNFTQTKLKLASTGCPFYLNTLFTVGLHKSEIMSEQSINCYSFPRRDAVSFYCSDIRLHNEIDDTLGRHRTDVIRVTLSTYSLSQWMKAERWSCIVTALSGRYGRVETKTKYMRVSCEVISCHFNQ